MAQALDLIAGTREGRPGTLILPEALSSLGIQLSKDSSLLLGDGKKGFCLIFCSVSWVGIFGRGRGAGGRSRQPFPLGQLRVNKKRMGSGAASFVLSEGLEGVHFAAQVILFVGTSKQGEELLHVM